MIDFLKKDINVKDIINSAIMCEKYKIKPSYSFMTGVPYESIGDAKKTAKIMIKVNKKISIEVSDDKTSVNQIEDNVFITLDKESQFPRTINIKISDNFPLKATYMLEKLGEDESDDDKAKLVVFLAPRMSDE
jgi:hypothetical protein